MIIAIALIVGFLIWFAVAHIREWIGLNRRLSIFPTTNVTEKMDKPSRPPARVWQTVPLRIRSTVRPSRLRAFVVNPSDTTRSVRARLRLPTKIEQ